MVDLLIWNQRILGSMMGARVVKRSRYGVRGDSMSDDTVTDGGIAVLGNSLQ